jgi:hypothetical protein
VKISAYFFTAINRSAEFTCLTAVFCSKPSSSLFFYRQIGFRSVRYYWSCRRLNQRCEYVCSIEDVGGRPSFVIVATEVGLNDLVFREPSCQGNSAEI